MSTESIVLISETTAESSNSGYTFSSKNKGAGYNKNGNGVHTVIYVVDDFIGSIKMQGTLELYPGENDWVDVVGTEQGLAGDSTVWINDTYTTTFTGKFVWVRAAYNIQNGTITEIRYNH
jgi:hypothetical protein